MSYEPSKTQYNDVAEGGPPVAGLWDNFGQPLINLNSYVTCDDYTPIAEAVLDAYGIPYEPYGFRYGSLKDMDIKRMDAMTAIRYSLMEESFASSVDRFIEMIVTEEGTVKFVEIGGDSASLNDVYYSVQTGQYVDRPRGVMVNGGKPIPEMQPMTWSPIWISEPDGADIFHAADMLDNCHDATFKSQATIVFNDPHLESTYEDGIDNLYEITADNPWDEILGYAVCIHPGEEATEKTTIQYNSEAEIPLRIAVGEEGVCPIGNLQTLNTYDPDGPDSACWDGVLSEQVSYGDGVPVEIPERFRYENLRGHLKDKFIDVVNVYVIGEEIDALYARPKDDTATLQEITEANATVWVTQHDKKRSTVRLDRGRHYAVAVEEGSDPPNISIVFAQEVRPHDKIQYGNGQGGGVEYRLNPFSAIAEGTEEEAGTLRATILPWQKTKGYFVQEIWVTVKVETPSITVADPDGRNQKALRIAENLQYYVAPMVMRSPPAPVGYQGGLTGPIDLVPTRRDNDPTTVQDFEDTDYERAMDDLQGSGMTITFSFLNGGGGSDADAAYEAAAAEAQQAAETIYSMINDDVTETVYTCGPEGTLPELGSRGPAGGIINSIRHSYSDQGSYTISVTEGPQVVGNLVQVDGGPTEKMAEEFGAKGVVTQALGDNIHFKVRLDGFGERWAVNTSHNVIRERDIVQCTVHNNPVEA